MSYLPNLRPQVLRKFRKTNRLEHNNNNISFYIITVTFSFGEIPTWPKNGRNNYFLMTKWEAQ